MKRTSLARRGGALAAAGLGAFLSLWPSVAQATSWKFTKSKLSNGMTLVVQEDHSRPRVALNIVYKVGSRDERAGRTGFAHLFEHLMFMGTKRVPEKKFDAWMEAAGGSNNAWTSEDLTDYHETAPSNALSLLLWLEADRLDALGREMTRKKLDIQRGVVRNERRQTSENTPYGSVRLTLPGLLFPKGHPYHHPVIGSHEDLKAATVGDVKAFFAQYYVPKNASIAIVGDVNPKEAKALCERFFGSIKGPDAPKRQTKPIANQLKSVVRKTLQDSVKLSKVVMAFPSPAHYEPGDAQLDLLAAALSSGKNSRLHRELVRKQKLAQRVRAYQASQTLGSYFVVEALARPGVDLDKLEKAIDKILTLKKPITKAETARAKAAYELGFLRGLQSLAGRASLLNGYEAAKGDPGYFEKDLNRYRKPPAKEVTEWGKKVLNLKGRVIIRVLPRFSGGMP